MTEVRATNLETLVNRIYGGNLNQILTTNQPNAWLETFLEQWVADEEKFFAISLEKEEIDMYNQALALHLIGEDEVTSESFILNDYQRPSIIRELAATAQARAATEQRELGILKEKRGCLRQTLARTNRLLESMTSKLANIKLRIDEYDRKLANLGLDCDTLTSESVDAMAHEANLLSTEFAPSVRSSSLLQKISLSLQEKYQFVKNLSSDTTQTGFTPEDFQKESWLLIRAFKRLEDKMRREEASKLLEELGRGMVPPEISTDEQSIPSLSVAIASQLQGAWMRDESTKLLHQERLLETAGHILRTQMLPPLILLYAGLASLQSHISNIRAQCAVLLSELERLASSMQEMEQPPPLTEEDDLLIRLSTLLQLDPGEQGELSAEAVLGQLAKLKTRNETGLAGDAPIL